MMKAIAMAQRPGEGFPAKPRVDLHMVNSPAPVLMRKESCACGGACPRCSDGQPRTFEPVIVQQREAPGMVLRRRGFDEAPMQPGDKTPVGEAATQPGRPTDIDAGLPPVPPTPAHGRCGPDMTDKITEAVDNTHRAFGTWRTEIKDAACNSLRDILIGGSSWDIMDINRFQIDALNRQFMPACASSPPDPGIACGRSIEVFPGCYYSGSANYVIFGHMFRICHDHYSGLGQQQNAALYSRAEAEGWADRWKTIQLADNTQPAIDWTRAGYNLWRRGSAQPTSDRPRCWANCDTPYTGDVLEVHWGPRYFRNGNGE